MPYRRGDKEHDGRVLAADAMPLDYFLAVMRDPAETNGRRERMATLAAPYCHEKVAYRALNKGDHKARAAHKAGDGTPWAELLNNGTPAARIGKNVS